MEKHEHWGILINAAFLTSPSKLPQEHPSRAQLEVVTFKKWPSNSTLPALPRLLAHLEDFLTSDPWRKCRLEEKEAKVIEENLNDLSLLFAGVKLCARQNWKKGPRGPQASFVHYYQLLKQLVISIVPRDCQSLMQALETRRLCIDLKRLEKLLSELVSQVPSLYQWLTSSPFKEERPLTVELFRQISHFCQNLPSLSKSALSQIPKLMHYICLNDSLEAMQKGHRQMDNSPHPRKTSDTISPRKIKERKYTKIEGEYLFLEENQIDIIPIRKAPDLSQDSRRELGTSLPRLFSFDRQIWSDKQVLALSESGRYSQAVRGKQDSPSEHSDRMRSPTRIPEKTASILSELSIDRGQTRSSINRSRLLTRTLSFDLTTARGYLDCEEKEEERRIYCKKKSREVGVRVSRTSQQVQLGSGKCRGWALVRQYVQRKIAERKVRRLFSS